MVNTRSSSAALPLVGLRQAVAAYVLSVLATLVVLALLTATGGSGATTEAWVHEIVVAVFAVLLPLRLRAAARGSDRALVAVAVIAAVLVVVNVVEALLDTFPGWLRVVMAATAVLMAVVAVLAVRARGRRPARTVGA